MKTSLADRGRHGRRFLTRCTRLTRGLPAIVAATTLLTQIAPQAPADPPCQTGVFGQPYAQYQNEFEDWCGGINVYGAANMDKQYWNHLDEWTGVTAWKNWKNEKPGRVVIFGMPMLLGDQYTVYGSATLAKGANEYTTFKPTRQVDYDTINHQNATPPTPPTMDTQTLEQIWYGIADRLVTNGLGDSVIRLGWEMNGDWEPWCPSRAAGGKPVGTSDFKTYFQNIVRTMRSVPNQQFKFFYCPLRGTNDCDPASTYPGDDYADIVGLDLYDYAQGYYPKKGTTVTAAMRASVWTNVQVGNTTSDRALAYWMNFAVTHNKKFALGEWGVSSNVDYGGGDNPDFITNMYNYLSTNAANVAFATYFDYNNTEGASAISPIWPIQYNPLASNKFWSLWNLGGGPNVTSGQQYIIDSGYASSTYYNTGTTKNGTWNALQSPSGFYRTDYLTDGNVNKGSTNIKFTPTLPYTGSYAVYVRWSGGPTMATNTPMTLVESGGTHTWNVNQQYNGNLWYSIGTYWFNAGTAGSFTIGNSGTNGTVSADAVMFIRQ